MENPPQTLRDIQLAPRKPRNEAQLTEMKELTRRFSNGELSDAEYATLSQAVKDKYADFKPDRPPEVRKPAREYNRKSSEAIARAVQPKRLKVFPATREALLKAGRSMKDNHDRALFFTLYLSGARISEIIGQDSTPDQQGCSPLIKEDFDYKPGVELSFALQTLKRHDRNPRYPTAPDREPYTSMIYEVLTWLNQKQDGDVIFNIRRTAFNNRLSKVKIAVKPFGRSESIVEKKMNPHYLRHCRLTHLAVYHHWTDSQIRTFAGWTTSALASQYVDLDKERQTKAQSNETYVNPDEASPYG